MPSQDELIVDQINRVSKANGFGSLDAGYTEFLRGLNHSQARIPVNANRDNIGLVFFTRPNLNLSYDNLAAHRQLMPFATQSAELSIQRYVRALLDPKGAFFRGVTSPLVNHHSPFINIMTNTLLSLSGWQDVQLDSYTSKEGIRKEQTTMPDGIFEINNAFDLSMTFSNTKGEPIMTLLHVWMLYMASVTRDNTMVPYPESITERRKDYDVGIYHFVLDPSRRFIQKWAKTIGYPTAWPVGSGFNYDNETPFINDNDRINTQFRCEGIDYGDPIVFEEFNTLVGIFTPGLQISSIGQDGTIQVEGDYVRIPPSIIETASLEGLPLIHPLTQELQWWVSSADFDEVTGVKPWNQLTGNLTA